jgi:DedD protein
MEKEMKKLLLVAVSVGFFLLVTITVAIIVLTPKTKDTAVASSIPYSNGRAQKNWDEVPAPAQTEIVNSQEPKKLDIAETDKNDGNNLTIIIPAPAETVADTVQTAEKSKVPEQPVIAVKAPEPVAKPTAQTASTTKPASASKTTAVAKTSTPAKSTKTISDFWVQTGAFSAQVRAEDARELLATKGITSIIENREINGKVWYRVRLGPYTSEREASHWLEIVKLIDGFNDSQIRQTARAQ